MVKNSLCTLCFVSVASVLMADTITPPTVKLTYSDSTLTVTGSGNLAEATVTDENIKVFTAMAAGKIYTKADDNTSTAVKEGDTYESSASYYGSTTTYGEAMTPSTSWNANYSMTTAFTLTLDEDESIHAIYWSDENAIITNTNAEFYGTKPSNWDTKDNSTGCYYYCIFKGAVPTDMNYTFPISSFKDGVYESGDFKITLLTDANRDNYASVTSTITASADNLYSKDKDASEYVYHAKETSWTYTDGQQLYIGTTTVDETAIADNATYFGTTHADYIESLTLPLADYMAYAVGDKCSTVIFKSETGADRPTISNAITRALVKLPAITTLNLRDTYLEALNPRKQGEQAEDPTFSVNDLGAWGSNTNSTLTTLYTPHVAHGTTLEKDVLKDLAALKSLHLSAGIDTLGAECISGMTLESIFLPNTLKAIKTNAFVSQKKLSTLTFPASLERIDSAAFTGTNPKDVYFLGVEAPKVARNAWGDDSYICNNSLNLQAEDDQSGVTQTVNLATGIATRTNYLTGNGWMTMLHYPSTCTKAQAAKYTDLTRSYKKIDYNDTELQRKDENGQVTGAYYTPGKEEQEMKGNTSITGGAAAKEFYNKNNSYGNDYNGGYDDAYVGNQYLWPSLQMAYRATVAAQNNKLWDGVASIAEGIKQQDKTYEGTGEEYIGLHQFALVKADAYAAAAEGWPMTTYADGTWHTICLPFSLTKAAMKELFNSEEIRLCKFSKVTRYVGVDDTDNQVTLCFNDEQFAKANDGDTVLQAHTPYMIKAPKVSESVFLQDYEIEEGDAIPHTVDVESEPGISTYALYDYYFIGNYMPGILMPQYCYFYSKQGNFRFQGGTTGKWNPYTAIVMTVNGEEDYETFFKESASGASTVNRIRTVIGADGGEATAIKNVTVIADGELAFTNANIYDLRGTLVSDHGTDGLAKGIYVVGGKKVFVK